MKRDINYFIQEGLLAKTPFVQKLAPRFIEKAKNNLITLSIPFDLHNNKEVRDSLNDFAALSPLISIMLE